MNKEQIERDAMEKVIADAFMADYNIGCDPCPGTVADALHLENYRKQSEGEWVTNAWDGKKWIIIPYKKHEHIGAHCSVCNKRALLNYDKDEVTSKFCPNCGARMKEV